MILPTLTATTLWLAAVTAPTVDQPGARQLSVHQKNVAARVYMESATRCLARTVASDLRFRADDPTSNLGQLIVESMPKCLDRVHDMIAAYDRYFGAGAGEDFFMGPYLDVLPNAIVRSISNNAN